jgi:ribosomal protein L7/L12
MRIRIWNAFASNNSGSYTIVGSFPSQGIAAEVAAALGEVFAAHAAWMNEPDGEEQGGAEPPLHRFIRAEGLSLDTPHVGLDDEWPQYGPPPEVCAVGSQVVVYVHYTISMPRTVGELFYRRGGRVDVELEHAHAPIIALFSFWVEGMWKPELREEVQRRVAALRSTLETEVLPPIRDAALKRGLRWVEPAWEQSRPGPRLGVVFPDLAAGVAEVQRCAKALGVELSLCVMEALADGDDPLAPLRRRPDPQAGAWQVVLWAPGPGPVAALKALREVTGLGLAEAKKKLAEAPCVLLERVEQQAAAEAATKLRAAGADASPLGPDDFAR